MSVILVSMIAYRERYIEESVRDCYDKSDRPEDLRFTVISEQSRDELHADLSFIPQHQLDFKKYDLSEFRGIVWSRGKTLETELYYDFVLYTCGHNRFAEHWDTDLMSEYSKARAITPKAVITASGPQFNYNPDETIALDLEERPVNRYRPEISKDYTPGYGFPNELQIDVPDTDEILEDCYIQFSWTFGPKEFAIEVPMDPDMGYHADEISTTIRSWAKGWRVYSSQKPLYLHDTHKMYPGEDTSRTISHRPWADLHKDAFWKQSDETMLRINKLMSGRLEGPYGEVTKDQCLAFCEATGMNPRHCEPDYNFDKLDLPRHGDVFRSHDPILSD